MKRIIAALAALTVMLCVFSACSSGNNTGEGETAAVTYAWPQAEWFKDVPEFKKGNISYSHIDTASTVNVTDSDYDEFASYIKKLKSKGFEFYSTDGKAEEKTYLRTDGTAGWTGSDGTVYIRVTYIGSDSAKFAKYNCNIVINCFSSKPSTWK